MAADPNARGACKFGAFRGLTFVPFKGLKYSNVAYIWLLHWEPYLCFFFFFLHVFFPSSAGGLGYVLHMGVLGSLGYVWGTDTKAYNPTIVPLQEG